MKDKYRCQVCKKQVPSNDTYEYRGIFSCGDCFDEAIEKRDHQRNELIKHEDSRTRFTSNIDVLSDDVIGSHNRKTFKHNLNALNKESRQMRDYEGR